MCVWCVCNSVSVFDHASETIVRLRPQVPGGIYLKLCLRTVVALERVYERVREHYLSLMYVSHMNPIHTRNFVQAHSCRQKQREGVVLTVEKVGHAGECV